MATTTIDLSNLNGINGFRLDGVTTYDHAGYSVSNAGDVNGDGFGDVIVSALRADPNGQNSGSSYVVFGKATEFNPSINLSNLDGKNGFRLDGEKAADYSGWSVSAAGDVNNDGFDDLIIGAPWADPSDSFLGSSYVVFGKATGFNAHMNLSSLDGKNGFRLDGATEYDNLGFSVSNAGDVNGDGFDDLIVGAPNANSNYYDSGSSYVVFGKASGFDHPLNLSNVDGANGFRVGGERMNDELGFSVSTAGDVNGDGFDDVIVGAPGADTNQYESGSSYVIFGKASGFNASMSLSSLDGNNGFRLDGEPYDSSSTSVSTAGDVNGDGFDDVIIGSHWAHPNGEDSGSSYVVFGKSSGFSAAVDLSSLNGSNGFRLDGLSPNDLSGHFVSTAGDVNGDGFDDLIVGAPFADSNFYNSGSTYIVFGKACGFSAAMDFSTLNGSNGFRLDGLFSYDALGHSVSTAGDVNGDGFDDLIVGAFRVDSNGIDSGASYVIFGRSDFSNSGLPEILGTPEDDQLKGTPVAELFKANDGDDSLLGRGGADIFDAGSGNDKINVPDLDFASIDGGSGNDVLHTDGKDLNLDLTNYLDKIQGIETICLYGRGDNSMTLTGSELKDLSDTTNRLKVHGNAGDQVILEGTWIDEGSHGFYHTYTQDDAVLLVGANLVIDFV